MRHTIVERGILFTVREVFNNAAFIPLEDAEAVLGENWSQKVEGLRRIGLLEVVRGKTFIKLSVHLPGDKKREYWREKSRAKKDKKHEEARKG